MDAANPAEANAPLMLAALAPEELEMKHMQALRPGSPTKATKYNDPFQSEAAASGEL